MFYAINGFNISTEEFFSFFSLYCSCNLWIWSNIQLKQPNRTDRIAILRYINEIDKLRDFEMEEILFRTIEKCDPLSRFPSFSPLVYWCYNRWYQDISLLLFRRLPINFGHATELAQHAGHLIVTKELIFGSINILIPYKQTNKTLIDSPTNLTIELLKITYHEPLFPTLPMERHSILELRPLM